MYYKIKKFYMTKLLYILYCSTNKMNIIEYNNILIYFIKINNILPTINLINSLKKCVLKIIFIYHILLLIKSIQYKNV